MTAMDGLSVEQLFEWGQSFAPRVDAMQRLEEKYNLGLVKNETAPHLLGLLPGTLKDKASLVTTIDALMEPLSPELDAFYKEQGVKWEGVGPLTGDAAARAGAMIRAGTVESALAAKPDKVLAAVQAAKEAGRKIVLVSMGTLVTGDDPTLGWEARGQTEDGTPKGLANKDVVRTAWAAVFDAVGAEDDSGPLIVVSIGGQKNALGDVQVPKNAICQQSIPQVDILREGVDCFIMGGGQNGFQEGLSNGTPFVIVPCVADQVVQGGINQKKGFGVTVSRPDPNPGEEEAATKSYREAIAAGVKEVLGDQKFVESVSVVKQQFQAANGVARVVELLDA